jgi:hypothetical protein
MVRCSNIRRFFLEHSLLFPEQFGLFSVGYQHNAIALTNRHPLKSTSLKKLNPQNTPQLRSTT